MAVVVDTFKPFGVVVSLAAITDVADNGIDPDDCSATLTLNSTGSIDWATTISGSGNYGNWVAPAPPGVTYYCRWTNNSGTLSSGTAGSWLSLASSRSWGVVRTTVGSKTCKGTLEIATDSGGTNVIATKTDIDLTATVGT